MLFCVWSRLIEVIPSLQWSFSPIQLLSLSLSLSLWYNCTFYPMKLLYLCTKHFLSCKVTFLPIAANFRFHEVSLSLQAVIAFFQLSNFFCPMQYLFQNDVLTTLLKSYLFLWYIAVPSHKINITQIQKSSLQYHYCHFPLLNYLQF